MNEMLPQLLLGVGNIAIGFGTGWVFRGFRDFRNRTRQDTVRVGSSASEKILDILDEVEAATTEESQSCISLRNLLVYPADVKPLESQTHAHTLYGRFLQTQQERIAELDPDSTTVSQDFVQQILVSRRNVDGLTGQLRQQSSDPAGFDPAELLERLDELERANVLLLDELASARKQIVLKSVELEHVKTAALEDFLTKLPNRRAFDQRFRELNATFLRSGKEFSLILVDLDEFKRINDQYGHDAGDAVLSVASRVLKETCRTTDHVSRFGGEEFAVLVPDTSLDGAIVLAERIRKRMESTVVKHQGQSILFTCSLGVAQSEDGCTDQQLLRVTDELLYAAKSAGRNAVRSFVDFPDDVSEIATETKSKPVAVGSA